MRNFSLMILSLLYVGCTTQAPKEYKYGWCYQPIYWPSDCVEPEKPSPREVAARKRAEFRKRRGLD